MIQTILSLWKDELETVILNSEKLVQVKNTVIFGWNMMGSKDYLNEPL